MRDVQPVLAAESDLEVVARDAGDLSRLEAEQLADAVVLVEDVVAGSELGERLQGATRWCCATSRSAAEDLCVREQREPELTPDEAAARGADSIADSVMAALDQEPARPSLAPVRQLRRSRSVLVAMPMGAADSVKKLQSRSLPR